MAIPALRKLAATTLIAAAAAVGAAGSVGAETQAAPTVAEAEAFLDAAEQKLLALWVERDRAQWVQSTHITYDTELLAAKANERAIAATVALAKEATRFDGLKLPPEAARKLLLLKLALTLPAPSDPAETEELTQIAASLEGTYGRGKYCPPPRAKDSKDDPKKECL